MKKLAYEWACSVQNALASTQTNVLKPPNSNASIADANGTATTIQKISNDPAHHHPVRCHRGELCRHGVPNLGGPTMTDLEDDYAYKNQWLQVETRGSCGDTYAMPIHTKEHGCIGWLYRIREDKGVALTFVPM